MGSYQLSLISAAAASSPPQEASSLSPFQNTARVFFLLFSTLSPRFNYESVISGNVAKWNIGYIFIFIWRLFFYFICSCFVSDIAAKQARTNTMWCLFKQKTPLQPTSTQQRYYIWLKRGGKSVLGPRFTPRESSSSDFIKSLLPASLISVWSVFIQLISSFSLPSPQGGLGLSDLQLQYFCLSVKLGHCVINSSILTFTCDWWSGKNGSFEIRILRFEKCELKVSPCAGGAAIICEYYYYCH